jgi:hypothetical protein
MDAVGAVMALMGLVGTMPFGMSLLFGLRIFLLWAPRLTSRSYVIPSVRMRSTLACIHWLYVPLQYSTRSPISNFRNASDASFETASGGGSARIGMIPGGTTEPAPGVPAPLCDVANFGTTAIVAGGTADTNGAVPMSPPEGFLSATFPPLAKPTIDCGCNGSPVAVLLTGVGTFCKEAGIRD